MRISVPVSSTVFYRNTRDLWKAFTAYWQSQSEHEFRTQSVAYMCRAVPLYPLRRQLYLTQFLSPYYVDQAREKRAVFALLQQEYPDNPYFVFLAIDEALTFYPDSVLRLRFIRHLLKTIPQLNSKGTSCKRYINLIKWQYSFVDTTVSPELTPSPIQLQHLFILPAYVADCACSTASCMNNRCLKPNETLYRKAWTFSWFRRKPARRFWYASGT